MCVIVHQPATKYLSKPTAELMWRRNSDGGGYAFIDDKGDFVVKKAMNFFTFWNQFERDRSDNRDKDFLVHFRIATSGEVGLDNTHPFYIDDDLIMAHNGMLNHITGHISLQAELSDTRQFIKVILPELPEGWLDNPVITDMVEDYIGTSKLMFLNRGTKLKKQVYILNKSAGKEQHGMWMSNTHHEPVKKTTYGQNLSGMGWQSVPQTSKVGTWREVDSPRMTNNPKVLTQEDRRQQIRSFREEHRDSYRSNFPIDSQGYLRELLEDRDAIGLGEEVSLDEDKGVFVCDDCTKDIDTQTAECECWDMLCTTCGSVTPYCACEDNRMLVDFTEALAFYANKEENIETKEQTNIPSSR